MIQDKEIRGKKVLRPLSNKNKILPSHIRKSCFSSLSFAKHQRMTRRECNNCCGDCCGERYCCGGANRRGNPLTMPLPHPTFHPGETTATEHLRKRLETILKSLNEEHAHQKTRDEKFKEKQTHRATLTWKDVVEEIPGRARCNRIFGAFDAMFPGKNYPSGNNTV